MIDGIKPDSPLRSLQGGHWFKLICGASYQYLPAIEHLTRIYALAGADCVDVAADPAVIAVARRVLDHLDEFRDRLNDRLGFDFTAKPWLMVSLNDGEDPHFRKATFDPQACPPDCSRPCETICPTQAIRFDPVFEKRQQDGFGIGSSSAGAEEIAFPSSSGVKSTVSGVQDDRCYGCGRCLPVCPIQHIGTRSQILAPDRLLPQIMESGVDALELHTQVGHEAVFENLWKAIVPWLPRLKGLAISCSFAPGAVDYLKSLYNLIHPLPCPLIWQADGRPMSGDIGKGTTHAAIDFAQAILQAKLPGYVQLAGGTNAYTVPKLKTLGLLQRVPGHSPSIAGIAYGSYARKLLEPLLEGGCSLSPEQLMSSIEMARGLIHPLKVIRSEY